MKHTGVLLLKYAAKALLNSSSFGLVPTSVVDAIVDGGESVAKDLWDWWGATTPEHERREAIEAIAKAMFSSLCQCVCSLARWGKATMRMTMNTNRTADAVYRLSASPPASIGLSR